MRDTTHRIRLLTASAAAAILLATAGSALAQNGPRRGPNDALRGPSVHDRAMPRDERFGESMAEGRRQAGGLANYRLMMASIESLADHENQRLRLTEEQGKKIREIKDSYQKALREYMEGTREQSQKLRERIRNAREEAGDDRQAVEEIMQRARERAQELRENAPSSEQAEAAIWKVLTQPQQRYVKAEIERRTDEAMRDRQMRRGQRGVEGQRGGAEVQRGIEGQRGGGEGPFSRERGERRPGGEDELRPGARRAGMPGGGLQDLEGDRPGPRGPRALSERDGRPMGPDAMGSDDRGARGARGPQGEAQRPEADSTMRRWRQLFTRIQKLSPEAQERLFAMIDRTVERVESGDFERPTARGSRQGGPGFEGERSDAPRRERRGPGAERDDAPRPLEARPDRPRRGPQGDRERD